MKEKSSQINQRLFAPDVYYGRRLKLFDSLDERIRVLLVSTPQSIFYLSGYQTFGEAPTYLCLARDGDAVHVMRELEAPLVNVTSCTKKVRTYSDGEDVFGALADAIKMVSRKKNGMIGVELNSLPVNDFHSLLSYFDGDRFVDVSHNLGLARVVKEPGELDAIAQAARLTDKGMKAAIDAVGRDATENDVAASAYASMVAAGAEWMANDPIVTSGRRSGIAHTTFRRSILAEGEPTLIELGACYHRYFSPLMRTALIGRPSKEIVSRYEACRRALDDALACIRPGVTSGAVHAAAQQAIDRAGYHNEFKKRIGYSVGIGFRTWSEGEFFDLKNGDTRPLAANMVLHLPPALRVLSEFGVGVSATIVVTDTGYECLSDIDSDLQLIEDI